MRKTTGARFGQTLVFTCSCTHPYQDKKYGNQRRVFNISKKPGHAKCTVCDSDKVVAV